MILINLFWPFQWKGVLHIMKILCYREPPVLYHCIVSWHIQANLWSLWICEFLHQKCPHIPTHKLPHQHFKIDWWVLLKDLACLVRNGPIWTSNTFIAANQLPLWNFSAVTWRAVLDTARRHQRLKTKKASQYERTAGSAWKICRFSEWPEFQYWTDSRASQKVFLYRH